jgi:tRNA threonylcarbamoyladenosine biosynthesis protein TsaB
MKPEIISIAIETSSRAGGVALGRGDSLLRSVTFDASRRGASQLISRLEELLSEIDLRPADLDEVYVSAGPGSFTGVRVGVTVARTLGQMVPELRLVGVPTALVVAENARDLKWKHLGVIMDARENCIHVTLFARREDQIAQVGEPRVVTPQEFLDSAPRPLMLIGEGLAYHDLQGQQVEIADPSLHLPTPEGVWSVGRQMARVGQFTDYKRLLPVYTRRPKALRVWNEKHN